MALVNVAPLDEFPPGSVKIVNAGSIAVGVYNLNGELYALEDRCSHDDGPLCEGDFDAERPVHAIDPRRNRNEGDTLRVGAQMRGGCSHVDE